MADNDRNEFPRHSDDSSDAFEDTSNSDTASTSVESSAPLRLNIRRIRLDAPGSTEETGEEKPEVSASAYSDAGIFPPASSLHVRRINTPNIDDEEDISPSAGMSKIQTNEFADKTKTTLSFPATATMDEEESPVPDTSEQETVPYPESSEEPDTSDENFDETGVTDLYEEESDEPAKENPSSDESDEENAESEIKEIELDDDSEYPKVKRKTRKTVAESTSVFAALKRSLSSEFRPIRQKTNSPVERRRQQVLQLRRQRGAAGTLLLLHALLTIFLMIVWAVLPRNSFGIDKLGLDGNLFSTLAIEGFAVLLPSAFVIYLYSMDAGLVLGRRKQGFSVFALAFLIGIPAALAFTGLNNISLYILSGLGVSPSGRSLLGQIQNPSALSFILLLLVTAFVPAIAEELMFRGVIQASLSMSGRRGLSLFLMATAFAIFHNDPYFILAPFAAGLYLGYLRMKTDNLYICMLTHFVMNATLLFVQPILPLFRSSMSFAGSSGRSTLYASLIAAAVAFVTLIPLSSALLTTADKAKKQPVDPIYNRLQQEQWFPADWKYMLALFVLFVTLLLVNS